MTLASEILVDHSLSLEWDRLPANAQQAARTFLHDTVCVGVAGRVAANADLIWNAARSWSGPGPCLILGRPGQTATAPYAAFTNAFQIHAQEFDCVHEAAVAHPLATVLAALMAEAQRSGPYDGKDFLAALVAGVDVVATLGVAATTPLKFFRPATAGVFGSIAALARLRRMERTAAVNAIGYGLAFASGTMQAHVEGKPTLAVQVAAAARSSIEAIDLAALGLEGPTGSIDGPFGYFRLFEDAVDLEPELAKLGVRYRIEEVSWKPFPTGRAAHGAIVSLRQMMSEHGVDADTLRRFVYRAPPLIGRLIGRRPFVGMKPAYARLCFAYLGAVVMRRGTVGLSDFTETSLDDPDLHALAERIVVEVDGNPDPAAFVPAMANATLSDGRTVEIAVTRQYGSPEWPLDRAAHFAKARACLAFGGLPRADGPLASIFESFETVADAAAALRPAFG